jgi:glycosyltransferase involved in cell wall biosynthesis
MSELSQSPKISIVMPTYNRAGFILETIESIRQQTYTNWELIIIDDGSEDNTEEIIKQVDDCRIQFYKAGKVGIGIKLKNVGIKRASGEFIAFMDSDDLWMPEKLSKQLEVLEEHPQAAFSITGAYNFRSRSEPLEYFYKQSEGILVDNLLPLFFTSDAAILPQTLMFRRECLNIIEKQVKLSPDSDVSFLLDLAAHYEGIIVYEPLLQRRLHDANFSTAFWQRGYAEMIGIIHSYKTQKLIYPQLARQALFKLYINYGEKHLRYKQKRKAIGKFFKAWLNKPFSIVPLKKAGKAILYFIRNK